MVGIKLTTPWLETKCLSDCADRGFDSYHLQYEKGWNTSSLSTGGYWQTSGRLRFLICQFLSDGFVLYFLNVEINHNCSLIKILGLPKNDDYPTIASNTNVANQRHSPSYISTSLPQVLRHAQEVHSKDCRVVRSLETFWVLPPALQPYLKSQPKSC